MRRAAKELAGDSEAGIRLEVPTRLQPSLKALEAVSFSLKQKNKDTKRSIKFDDQSMDLILDFNTKPDDPASPWRRVTADQAKQMKPKLKNGGATTTVSNEELENLTATTT